MVPESANGGPTLREDSRSGGANNSCNLVVGKPRLQFAFYGKIELTVHPRDNH